MSEGRPTKYTPDLLPKIDEYLLTCSKDLAKLPTRTGFAKFIQVNKDTLVEWEKIHPEFSVAIKKIDEEQQDQLINDGLYGGSKVSAPMAIFLLKANHNLKETNVVEQSGINGEPIQVTVYGQTDPLYGFFRNTTTQRENTGDLSGSAQVSSTELAQKSKEDNNSDQTANQMGTSS